MAKSHRECGTCSLCCKVMAVKEVKQEHEWCPHARCAKTGVNALVPGSGGCTIYPRRPEPCREFHCMYLIDEKIPDHWYPAKSKIVIQTQHIGGTDYIAFIVDPSYPRRWMEEPWFSDIKHIAKAGLEGRLAKKWQVVVMIKDRKIPIINSERLLRAAR